MLMSDWSSDVCSSDLTGVGPPGADDEAVQVGERRLFHLRQVGAVGIAMELAIAVVPGVGDHLDGRDLELGARFVVVSRLLAAQVIEHVTLRLTGIGHNDKRKYAAEVCATAAPRQGCR